jgi:hypothetical protein
MVKIVWTNSLLEKSRVARIFQVFGTLTQARCSLFLFSLILAGSVMWTTPRQVNSTSHVVTAVASPTFVSQHATVNTFHVFLPSIYRVPHPIFLTGIYRPGSYLGNQQTINDYFLGLDAWAGLPRSAGKGHSIAGDFIDFEVANVESNVMAIFETAWQNGYTVFSNIYLNATASTIANGQKDTAIRVFARAYKSWLDRGGNRRAFLAPLQEMNGYWVAYGMDPINFKPAFQRIVNLFSEEGIPRNQVWWTFAPNGYSEPPYKIKDYYPGDAYVDIIAFSAYNFGRCPVAPWTWWQTPTEVFGPYLTEIRQTVSASKPIFIAETASDSRGGDKNQWLRDTYPYLVHQNVRGILYFNGYVASENCDWVVYEPVGTQLLGYKDAVNYTAFQYLPPATLAVTPLLP